MDWQADDWQKHTDMLCRLRHGPDNYQVVPDGHVGDFGIEGFSLDGSAYQAYAPEPPLTTKERFEKQRNKISVDINKFCVKNTDELEKLFGLIRIKRWILLTPIFDSAKLIQFANRKTQEVRDKDLKYVHEEFQILIQTQDDFPAELAICGSNIGYALPPVDCSSTVFGVAKWRHENSNLSNNLTKKLRNLSSALPEIDNKLEEDFTLKYLRCQAILNHYKDKYPGLYEKMHKCISDRAESILIEALTTEENAGAVMNSQVGKLRTSLLDSVPGLDQGDLALLTWGTVADWLMRCPLDFRRTN